MHIFSMKLNCLSLQKTPSIMVNIIRPLLGIFLILLSVFSSRDLVFAQPKGMVFIPSGTFLMGADHSKEAFQCAEYFGNCKKDWYTREEPLHKVSISAFLIDKKEVTQGQYFRIMRDNPSSFKGAKLPVEQVTWSEANKYCRKVGKRLPTEAEWEYAARAGTKLNYYWGQKIGRGNANCDSCGTIWEEKETAPAGYFPPNSWGLYDMSGNVWEWVSDWFDPKYYSKSPRNNPRGPKRGKLKVARGGSWYDTPYYSRHAFRNVFPPAIRNDALGFRCAKTPSQQEILIASQKGKNTLAQSEIETASQKKVEPKRSTALAMRSKDVLENTVSSQLKQNKRLPNQSNASITKRLASPRKTQKKATGNLRIRANIPLAKATLNGNLVGLVRKKFPLQINQLTPGEFILRLEADGYKNIEETITIVSNRLTDKRYEMKNSQADQDIDQTANVLDKKKTPKDMTYLEEGLFLAGADPKFLNKICQANGFPCNNLKTQFSISSPVHEILIDSFYIDRFEVSQARYKAVTGKNPSKFKGSRRPVERVTWIEAMDFCRKIGKRLPTEMEWEFAARAGSNDFFYWGNRPNNSYSWNSTNSNFKSQLIGLKRPNRLGLHDMSGNVWEWVNDWFDPNYYKNSPKRSPQGPSNGKLKSLRGGSFGTTQDLQRPTARRGGPIDAKYNDIGFRCAKSSE
jgi:sulfatase modifying factor 1